MPKSLERRIAELEGNVPPRNRFDAIVHCIVDPGRPAAEMVRATYPGGEAIRLEEESSEDFEQRAVALARASSRPGQVARLLLEPLTAE